MVENILIHLPEALQGIGVAVVLFFGGRWLINKLGLNLSPEEKRKAGIMTNYRSHL